MHSQFSEWFRSAKLPLTDDVLQKRWAGVEAFEVDRDEITALVEVFFGNFEAKDNFLLEFRKAFQTADSSFRMKENNLELSVLAGAELVDVMERSSRDHADLAALALVSYSAQNLRRTPCVPEIPEYAVRYLAKRSAHRGVLTDDEKEGDEDSAIEVKQLRRDLDLLGEETNILWWIFGETSRDTNSRWKKLGVNQAAIMAAKELADLTKLLPGHVASAALLDRVIQCAKEKPPAQITVGEAVAELPVEWRQEFSKNNFNAQLSVITPISHTIKLSVDIGDTDAWSKSFEKSTKIQRGGKISPHLLSYQIFLEILTARVWKEA